MQMTTEEHKGNEGQNWRRKIALYPNYHYGESLKSQPSCEMDGFAKRMPSLPSLPSVELPFIDLWPN